MQTSESDLDVRIRSDNKRTLILHGFGISIKILDKKLVITNGKDRLHPNNQYQQVVLTDHADFDRIIIHGTGAISFGALQWLTEWGINVIMLDKRGRLYGSFNQIAGNTEPLIKQKQYACFDNSSRRLSLQKWVISHKITSQILLDRELQLDTEYIEKEFEKLCNAKKAKEIGEIEAHVSRTHYSNLARLFNPELSFETRRNPMTRRANEATDIINALLNYGFSILQSEVGKQLNALGLDCNVGFMHNNHEGYVPLTWDMMEPFRHLVDGSVVAIASNITKQDYCYKIGNPSYPFKSGSPFNRWLIMSSDLKKRYVAVLTAILQSKRYQKATIGRHTEQGFQKKEEITIMKDRCVELRDYVLERKKTLSEPPKVLMR